MELALANKVGLGGSANRAPVPMVSMDRNVSASVLVMPRIRKCKSNFKLSCSQCWDRKLLLQLYTYATDAIHLTDGAFASLVGKVGIVPALVPSINGDQDVPRHVTVSEMLPVIPS